jgi:rhamnulokinase
VGKKTRYLKNITGLWLLQECKKIWDADKELSYDEIIGGCKQAKPFRSLVDPDDLLFMNPPSMPEAIREYCRNSGQPEPETIPEFTRCILESLALKSRITLDLLRDVSPHPIEKIHIIGGGSLNKLLCQFTADATGLPVVAGPAEATALGNILAQIASHQGISDLRILREFSKNSVSTVTYIPEDHEEWNRIRQKAQGTRLK